MGFLRWEFRLWRFPGDNVPHLAAGTPVCAILFGISPPEGRGGCEQAASYLIQRVQTPLRGAEVMVPRRQLGLALVTAQQFADLPEIESLVIRDVQESATAARLRLETRLRADDYVDDLESRVAASADRV